MKWFKTYYMPTDEIVQCPVDDAVVKELIEGGVQLDKNVQLSPYAYPGVPILTLVSQHRQEIWKAARGRGGI